MNDLQLVKAILEGDVNSFETLIYRYEATIFRYISAMIKNPEDAKDLTQEVFITAYTKLYTYEGKSKLSTWLYKIARNKSLDYIKKNKGHIELEIENAWNISSKELSPEQWVEYRESKSEVEAFVKQLDNTTRQILILKSVNEKLKFADVAEILNINVSTVKTKYYKLWDKFSDFRKKEEARAYEM